MVASAIRATRIMLPAGAAGVAPAAGTAVLAPDDPRPTTVAQPGVAASRAGRRCITHGITAVCTLVARRGHHRTHPLFAFFTSSFTFTCIIERSSPAGHRPHPCGTTPKSARCPRASAASAGVRAATHCGGLVAVLRASAGPTGTPGVPRHHGAHRSVGTPGLPELACRSTAAACRSCCCCILGQEGCRRDQNNLVRAPRRERDKRVRGLDPSRPRSDCARSAAS